MTAFIRPSFTVMIAVVVVMLPLSMADASAAAAYCRRRLLKVGSRRKKWKVWRKERARN